MTLPPVAAHTSKAVVLHADRASTADAAAPDAPERYRNPRVSVAQRPLGPLHPDRVRVAMIYVGICGTDVHLVETHPTTGYLRCSSPVRIPPEGRIIGHEGVGRVLEIGSNVRRVAPGDTVAFESIVVCHACDVCRRGRFNQCRHARLLGLEDDGFFATIADVPAQLAHDVSQLAASDAGLRAAACLEPAGVAYTACESVRVGAGDTVVVFGAGPIGILAALLATRTFGASRVVMVEPRRFRRELARQWCDAVFDVEEFFAGSMRDIDVVIETSGQVENVNRVLRSVGPNGRIVLLAREGAPVHLEAVDHVITNAISIVGSRGHLCGAFTKILSVYESGRIPLDAIVTQVVQGPEELCRLLQQPSRILDENCKVLARFA